MNGDVPTFDRFAPVYDRLMPPARRAVVETAFALADRPVERVPDVAGGSGRAVRALDPSVDAVVVDAAHGMCDRARRHGLAVAQGDAARLPVADGAVDAVLVVDALHHVPDAAGVVREAARVLRPGGVLVVREFDPGTLRGRALVVAERLVGFDSRFYRPRDLRALVAAAGLSPVTVETGFAYTVVGRLESGTP